MTVFDIEIGAQARVETLRGTVANGEIVSRRIRDAGQRPVPYVTVQISENVALERPQESVKPI